MSENQLAISASPKASDQLASFLGIDKGMMLNTLKAQCFKGKRPDEVSDEQLAAFVSTANVLQVNPLVPGMLYAYPERSGGITPILGPDGVFKKLDEMIGSGKLAGFECQVFPEDVTQKPTHAIATIFRAGDAKPATYTALFSEWAVTSNPNWASRPRHMIWTRAIKQAARQVIHGLPMDADEYEIQRMTNVTGTAEEAAPETTPVRPPPPPRKKKGANAVEAEVVTEPAAKPIEPVPEKPAVVEQPAAPAPAAQTMAEAAKATHEKAQALKEDEPPVQPPAPPAQKKEPRAFLNANETFDGEIEIVSVEPMVANLRPKPEDELQPRGTAKAQVKGDYVGTIYDFAGAEIVALAEKDAAGNTIKPAQLRLKPQYAIRNRLRVRLWGRPNTPQGKIGAVVVTAEQVNEEF
jgi:hypothetical protein